MRDDGRGCAARCSSATAAGAGAAAGPGGWRSITFAPPGWRRPLRLIAGGRLWTADELADPEPVPVGEAAALRKPGEVAAWTPAHGAPVLSAADPELLAAFMTSDVGRRALAGRGTRPLQRRST